VQGILLGGLAAAVGLYLLRVILLRAARVGFAGMRSQHDPAGLFLVLLLFWAANWAVAPLSNWVSRVFETQADVTSLKLAGQAQAFIRAEVTLVRVNKGNVTPTSFNIWMFATHPSVLERIGLARDWEVSRK
jgi:STE24 endopeptidase